MFDLTTISLILGSIGTVGTVAGGLRALLASRKNLSIKIVDYTRHEKTVQFFMDIRNKSSFPIAISRIDLSAGPDRTPCELLAKKIRVSGGILYRTPLFPLNIAARTSRLCFLEFLDAPEISLTSGSKTSFAFDTNRGTIKKSVSLPPEGRYLHM